MTRFTRHARPTAAAGNAPHHGPQSTPDRPAVNPSTAGHPLTLTGWQRPTNEHYLTYDKRRSRWSWGGAYAVASRRKRGAGEELTEREAAHLLAVCLARLYLRGGRP